MENTINKLITTLLEVNELKAQINNREYWINRAKEEAGFIPEEGDWVHIEVQTWKVVVSVHHAQTKVRDTRYWINGQWFNTPFPEKYPHLSETKALLK